MNGVLPSGGTVMFLLFFRKFFVRRPKMKKNYALLLALVMLFALTQMSRAQELSEIPTPPNGNNEKAEVSQWIGLAKVTISYHSPNLHGGGGADRSGPERAHLGRSGALWFH
jgi:hypothetical protein